VEVVAMALRGNLQRMRLWAVSCVLAGAAACGALVDQDTAGDADAAAPLVSGAVEVRVLDRLDNGVAQYRLALEDGARVTLRFEADPRLRSGAEIEVWGSWLDERTLSVTSWRMAAESKRIDAPMQ
jgi:hypothetical protein